MNSKQKVKLKKVLQKSSPQGSIQMAPEMAIEMARNKSIKHGSIRPCLFLEKKEVYFILNE
jgi:hypothetical protein